MNPTVHHLLVELLKLIRQERQHALSLDMEGMIAVIQQKEAIIKLLGTVDVLEPEDQSIARDIREENRRNAFLFKETLNWIQETMIFFGRKTVPATYSPEGTTLNRPINGRLLSGRI